MNKIVTALAATLLLPGVTCFADGGKDGSGGTGRIEITVSDFVSRNNEAIGGSGSVDGNVLEASTAIAGSIVVESNCNCSISLDIAGMESRNNTAIGNAVAGSVVVRAGISN